MVFCIFRVAHHSFHHLMLPSELNFDFSRHACWHFHTLVRDMLDFSLNISENILWHPLTVKICVFTATSVPFFRRDESTGSEKPSDSPRAIAQCWPRVQRTLVFSGLSVPSAKRPRAPALHQLKPIRLIKYPSPYNPPKAQISFLQVRAFQSI